jgi:hypothetical protein
MNTLQRRVIPGGAGALLKPSVAPPSAEGGMIIVDFLGA